MSFPCAEDKSRKTDCLPWGADSGVASRGAYRRRIAEACRRWDGRTARRFAIGAGGALLAAMLLLPACGASPTASDHLSVTVTPQASLFDAPLSFRVAGARPGSRVTIQVSSSDSKDVPWSSRTMFVASTDGTVNPAQQSAVAGSYTGLDPMGPVDFMTAPTAGDPAYFWGLYPQPFRVTVTDGSSTASTSVERSGLSPGVRVANETIAGTGFYGQYWTPAGTTRHAAVMEFGGSEGGLDGQLAGALLASHGYPTLDIAYFGEPGLPNLLQNIPLEYFATALRWLAAQSQVDPHRIWVSGASRGSEAALLLGVHYPSLVYGVVASVPSDVVLCGLPARSASAARPTCDGPAWTLGGRPLPYTEQFDNPHPTDNPASVIPVGQIHGPILLDCGGADLVWDSCQYADAIMAELATAHDPRPHTLHAYPHAGHGVGALVPFEPSAESADQQINGSTPLANPVARADLWPKLLAFLSS